jgi:hypothetical protein
MYRIGSETMFVYFEKNSLWLGRMGVPGSHRFDVEPARGLGSLPG